MNFENFIFIMCCFIGGCLWLFFISRYFYFAHQYEKFLHSRYPNIANERKNDPLYYFTLKAFPVLTNPSSEAELKDECAIKLRGKAKVSFITAFLILIISPILGYLYLLILKLL